MSIELGVEGAGYAFNLKKCFDLEQSHNCYKEIQNSFALKCRDQNKKELIFGLSLKYG